MSPRPASTAAVAVIASWPGDEWLTETDLAEALAETHPVTITRDGAMLGSRALRSVLNEARRRSWLIRDQRCDPPVWKRTPTGALAVTD